jgi:hypothetical protein
MQVILNILYYWFNFVIYEKFLEEFCTVTDTKLVFLMIIPVAGYVLPVASLISGKLATGNRFGAGWPTGRSCGDIRSQLV